MTIMIPSDTEAVDDALDRLTRWVRDSADLFHPAVLDRTLDRGALEIVGEVAADYGIPERTAVGENPQLTALRGAVLHEVAAVRQGWATTAR